MVQAEYCTYLETSSVVHSYTGSDLKATGAGGRWCYYSSTCAYGRRRSLLSDSEISSLSCPAILQRWRLCMAKPRLCL